MNVDLNSIYYLFSTSAQVMAALVAVIATVGVFRWQMLSQQIQEKERHICKFFSNETNGSLYLLKKHTINEKYSLLTSDSERISLLDEEFFNNDWKDILEKYTNQLKCIEYKISTIPMELALIKFERDDLSHMYKQRRKQHILPMILGFGIAISIIDLALRNNVWVEYEEDILSTSAYA